MVARTVLLVIKFLEMEKGYATSNALMFAITILQSSIMVIPWDPGKFNSFMTRVTYQCCLRNSLSIYGLLNCVYDRGKIWLKNIWVLLMLVYDRGKFWSSSIWMQVSFGLSVFNGSIPMCFSSKWKDSLSARRIIETSPNLEDKVFLRRWELIETWIKSWALTVDPNQRLGKYILEGIRREVTWLSRSAWVHVPMIGKFL
jgi:hypothetical protein